MEDALLKLDLDECLDRFTRDREKGDALEFP
jgi:hypothetical protein